MHSNSVEKTSNLNSKKNSLTNRKSSESFGKRKRRRRRNNKNEINPIGDSRSGGDSSTIKTKIKTTKATTKTTMIDHLKTSTSPISDYNINDRHSFIDSTDSFHPSIPLHPPLPLSNNHSPCLEPAPLITIPTFNDDDDNDNNNNDNNDGDNCDYILPPEDITTTNTNTAVDDYMNPPTFTSPYHQHYENSQAPMYVYPPFYDTSYQQQYTMYHPPDDALYWQFQQDQPPLQDQSSLQQHPQSQHPQPPFPPPPWVTQNNPYMMMPPYPPHYYYPSGGYPEKLESSDESEFEVFELDNGEEVVVSKKELYGDNPTEVPFLSFESDNDQNHIALHEELFREFQQKRHDADIQKQIKGLNITQHSKNSENISVEKSESSARISKKKYSEVVMPKQSNQNQYNKPISNNINISKITHKKICPFFLVGNCKYGQECDNLHCFPENVNQCPHCHKEIGNSISMQQWHLSQPQQCIELDYIKKERNESWNSTCGICHENIMRKYESQGRKDNIGRFGILTGCNHTFCLDCLREWRGSITQSKEAIRGCPICREISYFIIPCDRLITNEKRKAQLVEKYKQSLAEIPCKHFQNKGECPFGTSCFYKHINKDGTIEEVNLRHVVTATGETKIIKPVFLSDFLFGPDD